MTNYIIRAGAVAATMLLPMASHAADLRAPVYKAPPPAPIVAFSWSGCYLGGQLGGQWGSFTDDVNYPVDPVRGTQAVVGSRDFSGNSAWLYGGQIGCNWQPLGSSFVLGVEGDIAGLSDGTFGGEIYRFPAPLVNDHFNTTDRYNTQGSLRLRAGFAFDRAMLYVAGGWTRANVGVTSYFYRDGDGSLASDASATRDGWNVGVGGEYAFASNWTLGVEYRYTDYGSFNRSIPAGTAGTLAWQPFTVSVDKLHTSDVRLRLNYLFNSGPVVARY